MKTKITQREKRRQLLPYGFMVKNKKITFFNREYLPIGMTRSRDLNGKHLNSTDYLNLFDWVTVKQTFIDNFIDKTDIPHNSDPLCIDDVNITMYWFYNSSDVNG